MDTYLAGVANFRRTGAQRPMSQEDEDAYYNRADTWSKLAWLGAAASSFSPRNLVLAPHEGKYLLRSTLGAEAG